MKYREVEAKNRSCNFMVHWGFMSPQKPFLDLYDLFASVHTPKEAEMLLKDMFTPQELDSIAERWQLIQELDHGTSQRNIAKKLNISISKITRGSRMMQYGSGGFKYFLSKIKKA